MKMYNVRLKLAAQHNGARFIVEAVVSAKHESEARALAFQGLSDPYLLDANVLTVDIVENLDRFTFVSINPA